MTADNFDTVFKGLQSVHPFQVYAVELLNGKKFEVDHAHAMVIRDGVVVFMAPGGIPVWFDHESVLRIHAAGIDAAV